MKSRPNPRDKTLRCLNCFAKLEIPSGEKEFVCPKCKVKYFIGWRNGQAKILGSEGI